MELHERIGNIQTKADLIKFIEALRENLLERPDDWENGSLEGYLSALASWLEVSDNYYRNHGLPIPESPSWSAVADMLCAASMYE